MNFDDTITAVRNNDRVRAHAGDNIVDMIRARPEVSQQYTSEQKIQALMRSIRPGSAPTAD